MVTTTRGGRGLAAVMVALSVAAGCVREEKFDERRIAAECAYMLRCDRYRVLDDCVAAAGERVDPYRDAALDAGRLVYDRKAARRCLNAIDDLECAYDDDLAAVSDHCDAVYQGQVAAGDPCLRDEECAGEAFCEIVFSACIDFTCCTGTCRELSQPLAVGELCDFVDGLPGFCDEDAFCALVPEEGRSRCTPRAAIGEACDAVPCAAGTYCDREGRCAAPGAEGAPCQGPDQCAFPLYCPGFGSDVAVCTAPGGEGEPCFPGRGEPCAKLTNTCLDGTCQGPGYPGDPCDPLGCVGYARCDGDTCVARASLGEVCEEGWECVGELTCDRDPRSDATCQGPGEVSEDDADCVLEE